MSYLSFEKEIQDLGFSLGKYKPHKHIALLAAIRLLKFKPKNEFRIYYNDEFRQLFSELFTKYACDDDRNRPYTPFFHLKSASFWKLIPMNGKENDLISLSSVGGPGQLMEVVSHAEISDDFHKAINDDSICSIIESLIIDCLENNCLCATKIRKKIQF